jgi:hypothetical protein
MYISVNFDKFSTPFIRLNIDYYPQCFDEMSGRRKETIEKSWFQHKHPMTAAATTLIIIMCQL